MKSPPTINRAKWVLALLCVTTAVSLFWCTWHMGSRPIDQRAPRDRSELSASEQNGSAPGCNMPPLSPVDPVGGTWDWESKRALALAEEEGGFAIACELDAGSSTRQDVFLEINMEPADRSVLRPAATLRDGNIVFVAKEPAGSVVASPLGAGRHFRVYWKDARREQVTWCDSVEELGSAGVYGVINEPDGGAFVGSELVATRVHGCGAVALADEKGEFFLQVAAEPCSIYVLRVGCWTGTVGPPLNITPIAGSNMTNVELTAPVPPPCSEGQRMPEELQQRINEVTRKVVKGQGVEGGAVK